MSKRLTLFKDGRFYVESKDLVQPSFLWKTQRGELILVEDMNTQHLFNAYKMLFNHTVLLDNRVGYFKYHPEVDALRQDYIEEALAAFYKELIEDRELSAVQQVQLNYMGAILRIE